MYIFYYSFSSSQMTRRATPRLEKAFQCLPRHFIRVLLKAAPTSLARQAVDYQARYFQRRQNVTRDHTVFS